MLKLTIEFQLSSPNAETYYIEFQLSSPNAETYSRIPA